MEIYSNEYTEISFEAPSASTDVSVTASFNDSPEISLSIIPETEAEKVKKVLLPYVDNEGLMLVKWTFEANTFDGIRDVVVEQVYDVVTPILSDIEIKEIHPNATEYELNRIEKAVRHIINAHTGQTFGKYVGVREVRGNNNINLPLPARLISINEVNGSVASPYFEIIGGGYYLRHYPFGVPPVKADYDGLHYHTGGIIHNPNNVKMQQFNSATVYDVDGIWGWESVPDRVKEAAKLLVNDYACGDANYRDRYLVSMTAADWRIQFHSGAYLKTGNVRADQLLNDYVLKHGWAVL